MKEDMTTLAAVLERLSADVCEKVETLSARPPETVAPPVDLAQLRLCFGDAPEEISAILSMYEDQMATGLNQLTVAIESETANDIYLIAHDCSGVSLACGINAVIEPLRELERMGRENMLTGAAEANARLGREFARVRRFLQERRELESKTQSRLLG